MPPPPNSCLPFGAGRVKTPSAATTFSSLRCRGSLSSPTFTLQRDFSPPLLPVPIPPCAFPSLLAVLGIIGNGQQGGATIMTPTFALRQGGVAKPHCLGGWQCVHCHHKLPQGGSNLSPHSPGRPIATHPLTCDGVFKEGVYMLPQPPAHPLRLSM